MADTAQRSRGREYWLGLSWGKRSGQALCLLFLPGGRWQSCVLQGSTSAGFCSCRLLQRLGGPMVQMTWRLRMPELQLLEHWGPQGGSGKREHACIGRETLVGWGTYV